MKKYLKKSTALMLSAAVMMAGLVGCSAGEKSNAVHDISGGKSGITYENEISVVLSDNGITAGGKTVGTSGGVFISNDVIYYEDKDSYESGNPYGEGTDSDKHTAEEAAAVTVVNITEAGIYRLSGALSNGQIRIDLGEDAAEDETAVVTLVFDGLDINCDIAPAVLFLNVYECDNQWSTETAASTVDTTAAGANVIIADGSTNNVDGAYVAKIFKDNGEEKKLWKQDGAFYSYMSMNINGETDGSGVLNIKADNEGLDSELHLTINGGNINIYSNNDGINTNEDGVSVTTINGGNIHIIAGLGEEGDGVDSNGWLVINGGTVIAAANPGADAGLDSDMGSFVNGGTVVALGSTMDWAESDSQQVTMNLQFAEYKESDSAIIVTKEDGTVVFAYDPSEDEVVGSNTRRFMGAVLSCADFALGESYNVYIGGTVNGSETAGVYDISTVTGFDGAVQQSYSGSDIMMRPGGMGFGGGKGGFDGQRPEMPQGEPPQLPEGFELDENGQPIDFDGERPQMPNGDMSENFNPQTMKPNTENGERPQLPEGFEFDENGQPVDENGQPLQIPDRGTPPWSDKGTNAVEDTTANTGFFMQDKVNNFSGVSNCAK